MAISEWKINLKKGKYSYEAGEGTPIVVLHGFNGWFE